MFLLKFLAFFGIDNLWIIIRRGLITKENELVQLLQEEEIDVMFLTETDTSLQNAETFQITGYTTHIQLCKEKKENVRIIALTKDNCGVEILRREDLMSGRFPSIWIELRDKYKSGTLVGFFFTANGRVIK